jgi:branched-chain amino acid transport system substrate-binding protein
LRATVAGEDAMAARIGSHGFIGLLLALAALAFAGAARADVTVATVGPMTGQYAMLGGEMRAGAELAVADINAAGGVNGQKLVLEVGDDSCDAKQAVADANQLAGKGALLVDGHLCSGASIPASGVYAEQKIVEISPGSTNPKYTDERPGPGIFRVCGRDDRQGLVAGQFLAKNFAKKNIAIIHDRSAYGASLADATRAAMNTAGKKETLTDTYDAGQNDYSSLVSKLRAANIDVLYVGGYFNEAGLIARAMRDQGMGTILVSGDALATDEFWAIAGDAGEGTLMTYPPDPRRNPEVADVVARFRAQGVEPEGLVLYSYATIQVWAQAAAKAGSTDFDRVIAEMAKDTFNTVLGPLQFDEEGDVKQSDFVVYEWHAGTYDYRKM